MKNNASKGGIGFCGLLTILFIALKLCGVIKWSLVWVISPIWIPPTIFCIGLIIYVIVALLIEFIKGLKLR